MSIAAKNRNPIEETVLVLAAHPDDEVLGAGAWLSEHSGPLAIAFLTDGAPRRAQFRPDGIACGAYRRLRRQEAQQLWRARPRCSLHFCAIADQALAFHLGHARLWLAALCRRLRPHGLLAPAFEGGHPDHDAVNFLASRMGIPTWEYALYSQASGCRVRNDFPGQPQWRRDISESARAWKTAAFDAYASQRATLAEFDPGCEALRPLPRHDYSRPALNEPAVYEIWGWPWTARQIAARLAAT